MDLLYLLGIPCILSKIVKHLDHSSFLELRVCKELKDITSQGYNREWRGMMNRYFQISIRRVPLDVNVYEDFKLIVRSQYSDTVYQRQPWEQPNHEDYLLWAVTYNLGYVVKSICESPRLLYRNVPDMLPEHIWRTAIDNQYTDIIKILLEIYNIEEYSYKFKIARLAFYYEMYEICGLILISTGITPKEVLTPELQCEILLHNK